MYFLRIVRYKLINGISEVRIASFNLFFSQICIFLFWVYILQFWEKKSQIVVYLCVV